MKNYKVNVMKGGNSGDGFGPGKCHLEPFIHTNQYVIWTRLNDKRYNSFSKIQEGDSLHILKPKTEKRIYYRGKVLSDMIINNDYVFSKNILEWDWEKLNRNPLHVDKKELRFIVLWEKQPYPDDELYQKINKGFNAQSVKEIIL